MTDDDLLAAYVDGVTELATSERKRVEAHLESDPLARTEADATRDLLGKLRELPREGTEPNWSELEAAIHREVGDALPRKPWWRSWRWVVPTAALASVATIAIMMLAMRDDELQPVAHVPSTPHTIEARRDLVTPDSVVWIDDQAIDLDSVDADKLLDAFDDFDELDASDSIASDSDGLLPVDDLGWVDNLDDKALDRAEALLEHKKKS